MILDNQVVSIRNKYHRKMATTGEQTSSASEMDVEKGEQRLEKDEPYEHPHRQASHDSSQTSIFSESHSESRVLVNSSS